MDFNRFSLSTYRIVQYFVCRRYRYGILKSGTEVTIDPFRIEENHGDIVHPCIRYIEDGYLGHKWWMVYTPYYNADASLENPILCYADNNDATPPTEWKFYCLINDKPYNGYNSDPTLLYKDGALYVFWRENYEDGTYAYYRATYGAKVIENGIRKIENPLLLTRDPEEDPETCPCFMPSKDGQVMAYGMHLRFHSPRIKRIRQPFRNWISKITLISDLLGLYSQQKHFGLALWQQDDDNWLKPYKYIKTVRFKRCNVLYRPWHMDFFDWCGKRYAIVQTNQCNADIALAVSEDYENFTFFKKPLITNATIGKLGIYKPCALVIKGMFFLYYTAQDADNRSLNKLYCVSSDFASLLNQIR